MKRSYAITGRPNSGRVIGEDVAYYSPEIGFQMREYQRLAFLKRSLLTKVSACHEHRFQFVFRFPQVFRYQMHHAIFRLDCAAKTEKAHRLCQYGITLKDTFPNDNVDESRLILRHRVSGRCRQITKITRAMMGKAEAERCAVVMVRGVKASAVRAVRAI